MIQLNDQQKEASSFMRGVASVIAVPGSGKTLTMTHRIGNLVKMGVSPESILGLTFTRNAAQAMRDKLKPILNELTSRITLSTMHSFCHSLLRNNGRTFDIVYGKDQVKFIRKILKKLRIKNLGVGCILGEISLAKSNLISFSEFKELYYGDDSMEVMAKIYEAYELEKQKALQLDFDDLLIESYNLLKNSQDVKETLQQTYKHILVDEFQDTNPAQMEILNLLIDDNINNNGSSFWVCGDDWQSIYSFTGSTVRNIINFDRIFENSKQFILDLNYRSTPQILNVCQNLILHNNNRIDKTLRTENSDGEDVTIIDSENEEDEGIQIVNEIKDLVERRGYSYKDIAILYRANFQSRIIEETFLQHKIPYHIENGLNFYQRYEVSVLLDYLRVIKDPCSEEGDEALKRIINIPNRYFGRKFVSELEEYSNYKKIHLYKGLKSVRLKVPYLITNIRELLALLDPMIKDAKKLSPSELIYLLREGLDYDKYVTDDDIPSPDDIKIANLDQLQMAATKFKNIPSFLNYTETFQETLSNDKDGVSLMTIHKSKGLEFPVVFVIGFVEGLLPNKNGEIEEERRVAFVGLSRAMKLLYLTYSKIYLGKEADRSSFLDEIIGIDEDCKNEK